MFLECSQRHYLSGNFFSDSNGSIGMGGIWLRVIWEIHCQSCCWCLDWRVHVGSFVTWGFKFNWPGDLSWWTQVSRTIRSFLLTGFPSLQGYLNCFLFTCQSRMLFLTQKNREKYYCTLNRLRFCFMYIYHFQLFSTKKVGGKFEEQNKENPIADSRGTRWIQLVNLGVLSQERCC